MKRYEKVYAIIEDILGDDRIVLDIDSCEIFETDNDKLTKTVVKYRLDDAEELKHIETSGDGFVDALVAGFVEHLSEEYKSLQGFYLCRYEVRARIKKGLIGEKSQTDAKVEVEIGIKTQRGQEILFKNIDKSVVRASTKTVRDIVQFMINCEEAVKKARLCLTQSQSSGRVELVEKYTKYLTELVVITNYDKVLN